MCKQASIGCVGCKKLLSAKLNEMLDPIREKRHYYENNVDIVREIIAEGTKKANIIGNKQVENVKNAMSLVL